MSASPPEAPQPRTARAALAVDADERVLNERRVRPKTPTLVMLDEVAALGAMDAVRTLMTLSRGYGARAMLFVQSLAQLRKPTPTPRR